MEEDPSVSKGSPNLVLAKNPEASGVGEAVLANKEQNTRSAGKTGACANAKAAVRCLVAVLTVACYYQGNDRWGSGSSVA